MKHNKIIKLAKEQSQDINFPDGSSEEMISIVDLEIILEDLQE